MEAGVLEQSGRQRVVGNEVGEILGGGNVKLSRDFALYLNKMGSQCRL